MHPSEEVYCEKGEDLVGKTIVMGITGSIAATECFHTIRELIRYGATVKVVMTPAAAKLVAPDAIEFACGSYPVMELTGATEHVDFVGSTEAADLLLIYPATANTVSKIAVGIDDTAVTSMATVALGDGVPMAIAPAMHESMFRNPAVAENIARLKKWGVEFFGPRTDGIRARVATTEEVVCRTLAMLSDSPLKGKRILIIGGRSEEPIDDMRVVTNRSSGTMAVALAMRAFQLGAEVDLWMGGCSVQLPDFINIWRFTSVDDIKRNVILIDHDAVIVPAALSDFAPEPASGKIPSDSALELRMEPAPKMLPLIREMCPVVIGFKAESGLSEEDLCARARSRLDTYGLHAIVANDVSCAGDSKSKVCIITKDNMERSHGTKTEVADAILSTLKGAI